MSRAPAPRRRVPRGAAADAIREGASVGERSSGGRLIRGARDDAASRACVREGGARRALASPAFYAYHCVGVVACPSFGCEERDACVEQ